ncbi:unnamed protein product [Lampetra planeri]
MPNGREFPKIYVIHQVSSPHCWITGMTQKMLLGRNWALCQFARTSIVAIYKKNAQEGSKRKSKEEYAKEHNIYGGDPEQPHKLHIVRRIRSIYRRPYWEKLAIKNLGLTKRDLVIHKNIESVNAQLTMVKHLIKVQPLKLPQGLPTEEEFAHSYINSKGELIIQKRLSPVEQKQIEAKSDSCTINTNV